MQFFRSCFRERGSPNGEDFYPQTRRFPAAILGGLQGEATQYTDKKTAQAVCNAYENGFSGRNEMKEKGWRPFWAALLAALLVLLPLVGGTVLLSRAQLRSSLRQAAKSQSGVPIRLPKATDRCTVLLCVADETPGFVLAYLNAGQNCIHLLAVPAALEVPFGGKNVPLADCYAAAGPARCREALGEVFALPEDTDYLAIAPAVLTKLAARYGAVRVGFTGALTPEQLARYGKGTGVQGISAADAHSFLAALDADTSLSPRRSAAARAAVWDAFFRQALELLPTTLPQGLREVSSSLLTSLTAVDLATLERTLEFLATSAEPVDITADALPGDWAGGHYTVSDASRAAVQSFFNLSPAAAQSESGSEP